MGYLHTDVTERYNCFYDSSRKGSELIEPLQRFIESSTLGEFASRVQMLFAFYKEMCYEEGSTWKTEGDLLLPRKLLQSSVGKKRATGTFTHSS